MPVTTSSSLQSWQRRSFAVATALMLTPLLLAQSVSGDDPVTTSESAPAAEASDAVENTGAASPTDSNAGKEQAVRFGAYNPLNRFERYVLMEKGTERASTGGYTSNKKEGTYLCRRCNAKLYLSGDKFESNCGWPSFDDEIKDAVARQTDADGARIEIICKNCGGHLGHVFNGEQMTEKNTRHCVNSISMRFIPKGRTIPPMIKSPSQRETTSRQPKEQ